MVLMVPPPFFCCGWVRLHWMTHEHNFSRLPMTWHHAASLQNRSDINIHVSFFFCFFDNSTLIVVRYSKFQIPQAHSEAVGATEHLKHELSSERDRAHNTRLNFTRDLETCVIQCRSDISCVLVADFTCLTRLSDFIKSSKKATARISTWREPSVV